MKAIRNTGAALALAATALVAVQANAQERSTRPELAPMERVPQLRAEQRKSGEDGRVFGGFEAKQDAWPFQVGLLTSDMLDDDPWSQFDAQFCGGSLIAPQWVLTAAHCLVQWGEKTAAADVTILVGATVLNQGQRVKVSEVIAHEGYNEFTLDNDIGLLKLAEPVSLPVVKLPPSDLEIGKVTVTGWGRMEDGTFPDHLMQAELDLQSNATCNAGIKQIYASDLRDTMRYVGWRMRIDQGRIDGIVDHIAPMMGDPLTGNMLCAGTTTGVRDACNGDSGGPLFAINGNDSVQYGIVSWGEGPENASMACGHANAYGIYTRVSVYKDWIAQHAGVK